MKYAFLREKLIASLLLLGEPLSERPDYWPNQVPKNSCARAEVAWPLECESSGGERSYCKYDNNSLSHQNLCASYLQRLISSILVQKTAKSNNLTVC